MKLPTLSALLLLLPVASGSSLRGDFEADVAGNASRRLAHDCVDGSAEYLGCFQDRNTNRVYTREIGGRPHTAKECQSACRGKGYAYFGRQWKGQCFCGQRSNYDKHGRASDCDCCGDNVGPRKMCVWTTGESAPGCDGAPGASYIGCYRNRNRDRALPYKVGGMGHSAEKCQRECKERGMKYFAREWKGQCFCSNDDDYDKHGSAGDCKCCGANVGARKMCVWKA